MLCPGTIREPGFDSPLDHFMARLRVLPPKARPHHLLGELRQIDQCLETRLRLFRRHLHGTDVITDSSRYPSSPQSCSAEGEGAAAGELDGQLDQGMIARTFGWPCKAHGSGVGSLEPATPGPYREARAKLLARACEVNGHSCPRRPGELRPFDAALPPEAVEWVRLNQFVPVECTGLPGGQPPLALAS